LVAQFNLYDRFSMMIGREIANAGDGFSAGITIKLNNLEEESLIRKLYEASNAGVRIQLIVRGICRLIPGVRGQSENIVVHRIVDRYLEHGRIFIFQNRGNREIFLGSADWMTRNIFHRVEVCFPLYDPVAKEQIMHIIGLQLRDNVQAVSIGPSLENQPITGIVPPLASQQAIYEYLGNAGH
ncbi:MAG: polyphosphate kinase 1, partial [Sphingobacteriales bacterium]